MPDSSGKFPGDPGYNATTDPTVTANSDGTFTDSSGNTMDMGGGLLSAAPSDPNYSGVGSPSSDQFQAQQTTNPFAGQPGQNSTAALNQAGFLDTPASRALQAAGVLPSTVGGSTSRTGGGQQQQQQQGSNVNNLLSGLDQQLAALMGAMSATNAQDFQEKVREFNVGQANWLQQFNAQYGGTLPDGGQTLQAQAQQFSQAATAAGLTGIYNPPGAAGAKASPLAQYQPGTVVRTNGNQFGIVGANGSLTVGGPDNPTIYQAIQANQGIPTVSDGDFAAAQQVSASGPGQQTLAYGQLMGNLNGQPTLAGQNQQAQLTGMFNGNPTPAYQQELANITGQFNGRPTEAARQFNTTTATDLAKLASSLSGPADYFKYLTALNGGRNILSNLTTGQAMPAGGAPVGGTQPQTLDNILGQLGIGGGSQAASLAGALPTPNQIQPTAFNSMSPSAQQFMQGAYAAAGYDPADLQRSILGSTPASPSGSGPSSETGNTTQSTGASLFA